MARKIARQSETTPSKTIDDYLWNERLGVTQLPPVDTSQGQQNMSSLPPQTSQAPTIDYDAANGQNDMFGSGVSSEGQPIAPKVPMQERSSAPAVSKAASNEAFNYHQLAQHLIDEHEFNYDDISDHANNVKEHNDLHSSEPAQFGDQLGLGHRHSAVSKPKAANIIHTASDDESTGVHLMTHHDVDPEYVANVLRPKEASTSYEPILTLEELHNLTHRNKQVYAKNLIEHEHPLPDKTSAVSTLYGDVNPTPTTGDGGGNGSQSGRNNSPDPEPNSPEEPSASNVAPEEEGGAGLASELGEAASLAAFASKRFINDMLTPVDDNLKFAKYHYIRKEGNQYCIWSKHTGKTLSCHDSESEAESAFRAMEAHLH